MVSVTRYVDSKVPQFPSKVFQKYHSGFDLKVKFFKIAQIICKYLEYFVRTFVAKNFQKSANLVTLDSSL